MAKNDWFGVNVVEMGKREEAHPKAHILRELIANAFDEQKHGATECFVTLEKLDRKIKATVTDNSPLGFLDKSDIYTLHNPTPKTKDPTVRGRFNLGEKQAISRCSYARVETTSGSIFFDDTGRHNGKTKTSVGSKVEVIFSASQQDFDEILAEIKTYLVPKGINYTINGEQFNYTDPFKTTTATLATDIENENGYRRSKIKTEILIYSVCGTKFLYELGIPIIEIDCSYSINVMQKVPLDIHRETVSPAYLKDLYGVVLNVTYEDIPSDHISEKWIREGTNDRTSQEALHDIRVKRFGENAVVCNPNDPEANRRAEEAGARVISGNEMCGEEWAQFKDKDKIPSSSEKFGSILVGSSPYVPTANMFKVADLAKKIADRLQKTSNLSVDFIKTSASNLAEYCRATKSLTFNVSRLGIHFFDSPVSAKVIDIIIHELAHEAENSNNLSHKGEEYYLEESRLGGELTILALNEPNFFR